MLPHWRCTLDCGNGRALLHCSRSLEKQEKEWQSIQNLNEPASIMRMRVTNEQNSATMVTISMYTACVEISSLIHM